jgi:hypothetical protein
MGWKPGCDFCSTPPEACCVLTFRAKMSGTTHTGSWYLVVRPLGEVTNPKAPKREAMRLPG